MESITHHMLVNKIYDYVASQHSIKKSIIESDIFEVEGNVSRMQEGYIPDLYYNYQNLVVIGEAKTENDLERIHSIKQFESYIAHLSKYKNIGYNTILIICVPWQASITAIRIMKRMLLDQKIKLIVMNEMGVYKKYEEDISKE